MRTCIIRLFILLGLIFPALASMFRKRSFFRHFRLLVAGLVLYLGALSTNAFALMGGAVQNGNVALGNMSGVNGVMVSMLAGNSGSIGSAVANVLRQLLATDGFTLDRPVAVGQAVEWHTHVLLWHDEAQHNPGSTCRND